MPGRTLRPPFGFCAGLRRVFTNESDGVPMITLEKIETLRARTGAGFAEVKAALEAADGDVEAAEAILNQTEHPPENGGAANARADPGGATQGEAAPGPGARSQQQPGGEGGRQAGPGRQTREQGRQQPGAGPGQTAWHGPETEPRGTAWGAGGGASPFLTGVLGFLRQLAVIGNRNRFEIFRNGSLLLSIPLSILAILLVPLFWAILPSLFAGFFLGCSYRFCGPDFKRLP